MSITFGEGALHEIKWGIGYAQGLGVRINLGRPRKHSQSAHGGEHQPQASGPRKISPALLLPLLDTTSYGSPASLQPVSSKLDC